MKNYEWCDQKDYTIYTYTDTIYTYISTQVINTYMQHSTMLT